MTVAAVLRDKDTTVISVAPSATVQEIADIISSKRIGAVMVLRGDGSVAGIVSERDVVKALAAKGAGVLSMRADDLMTRDVKTAGPSTSVEEAMEIMDHGYFRHLPVMIDGKLAGIVSIRDLVKHRIRLHEQDADNMKAYISGRIYSSS